MINSLTGTNNGRVAGSSNDLAPHGNFLRRWAGWIVPLLLLVGLLQDYAHAHTHAYTFYLKESLLFNLYWVGFLGPLILVQKFLKAKPDASTLVGQILAIWATMPVHLIGTALLIQLLSGRILAVSFNFSRNLSYLLTEHLGDSILAYGGMAIGLILYNRILFQKATASSTVPPTKQYVSRLAVQHLGEKILLPVEDIHFIRSESPYLALVTTDRKMLYASTLKYLESSLDPAQFVRVHRSCLVNVEYINAWSSRKNGDYDLLISNGETLRLSRHYVRAFRRLMND